MSKPKYITVPVRLRASLLVDLANNVASAALDQYSDQDIVKAGMKQMNLTFAQLVKTVANSPETLKFIGDIIADMTDDIEDQCLDAAWHALKHPLLTQAEVKIEKLIEAAEEDADRRDEAAERQRHLKLAAFLDSPQGMLINDIVKAAGFEITD